VEGGGQGLSGGIIMAFAWKITKNISTSVSTPAEIQIINFPNTSVH